ncbi:MAG: LiaI-LiaF-like domain-containing protein, partial [Chloroflexota bacterium]
MFGPGYFDGGRLRAVEQESQRVQGLVGPIFLVGLGLLLLLNNLGILAWSIWEVIFRLWPVLLIIVGLDLILSRSSLGRTWRILGALLMLLVVLSAVTLGAALNVTGAAADSRVVPHVILGGGKMVSENVDQPLDDAQRADVDLDLGVGEITVRAQSESGGLIEGTAELREGEKLLQDFRVDGDTAYYSLRQDGVSAFSWDDRGRDDGRRWDLRLNPDIP